MAGIGVGHVAPHTLYDKPDDDALDAERRADRIGLRLADAAGFDISGAVAYWEEIAMEHPVLIGEADPSWRPLAWEQPMKAAQNQTLEQPSLPHPEIARRMSEIRRVVAELQGDAS